MSSVTITLRILYLTPYAQAISGADESLAQILEHWHAHSSATIQTVVIAPRGNGYIQRYRQAGAHVIEIPAFARLQKTANPFFWIRYILLFPWNLFQIVRCAWYHRVDIIHTNESVLLQGGVAARLLRKTSIVHCRQNAMEVPNPMELWLARLWLCLADHIFVISKATGILFRGQGIAVDQSSSRVSVLYPGLPLSILENRNGHQSLPRELPGADFAKGMPLIGTVGRMHSRKRPELFIRMAAILYRDNRRLRFCIVGGTDGSGTEKLYIQRLHEEAIRLGVEEAICWAGAQTDILAWMRAFSVFVMTSRDEGFGRVLLEAMAVGTPIVATRSGAVPEVLDGAGVLVDADHPESYARAVSHVLQESAERERLIQLGRAHVERRFSIEKTCATLMSIYLNTLKADSLTSSPS